MIEAAPDHTLATKTVAGSTTALDSSPSFGVLAADVGGVIHDCNPRMAAMLGYRATAEIIGRHLVRDFGLPRAVYAGWLSQRTRTESVNVTLRRRDAGVVTCRGDIHLRRDACGAGQGIQLVLADYSEQQQLEQALAGASRTEALRALTAGAAHDFSNLLTIIVGNLYLLVESLRDEPALLTKVKAARDAARRGSDLARQLLSFATQKPNPPEVTELAGVIRNLEQLLGRALGQRIELCIERADDVWPICVDVTQFESAIINLAVNSRDAMNGSGRVTISARNCRLDAARAAQLALTPGDYVEIEVSDDGPGIPESIHDRVFTPFFTTKEHAGGSGLGLCMVQRLARDAHGAVELVHPQTGGASFRLLFPRAATDTLRATDMTQPLSTLPTGHERVLVHCSDAEVATTINQLLSVLGYAVDTSAERASLPAILQSRGPDLLVWDDVPGASAGPAPALDLIKKKFPALKILLVTDDNSGVNRRDAGMTGQLRKPLVLAELATAVRRAIDRTY